MILARVVILCLLIATAAAAPASACSVPVFRYALNYWPADEYELQAHAAKLPDDLTINLNLKEHAGPAKLVLADREVWSGDMNPVTFATLLDSPIRRQIISGILHGDSVVWILVESGDASKDAAATDALTKRLKYLESIAVMPELRPDDPFNRIGPGPTLTIRHSVIRLSRKDAGESFTLAMLERGSTDPKTPTAYPIFGRGRALIALPQEKLTPDNIDEIALFLTSACSCEVKDRRQGWDLLLQVDWDEELARVEQKRLNGTEDPRPATAPSAPTTRTVSQSELKPETVVFQSQTPVTPSEALLTWTTRKLAIAGVSVILISVAGVLWMRKQA